MLEWVLQNDIVWSKNAKQFARTKTTKIFGCFSLSSPNFFDFCVCPNNVITKLVFDVFAIPLTQSKLGGKEP